MKNSIDERDDDSRNVTLRLQAIELQGTLTVPRASAGIVLFAHGSGSSRHSPRNRFVAEYLHSQNLGTLLLDLLTAEEERADEATAHLRFNIPMLAGRVASAVEWLLQNTDSLHPHIGLFGASTGAAAALIAAAQEPNAIDAVVSRGVRPDLAGDSLSAVRSPTLLIVGGDDGPVIGMNRVALQKLGASIKEMQVIPGASHLFEEPGKLAAVAQLAAQWFKRFFVCRSE